MVKLPAYGLMVIGTSLIMTTMITRLPGSTGISESSMISFTSCNHNVLLAIIIISHPCRVRIFKCLKRICLAAIQQDLAVPLFHHYHSKHVRLLIIHGVSILLTYHIKQKNNLSIIW